MPAEILEIEKNSIAEDLGLSADDLILKINGTVPKDYIDYKFLTSCEELELLVKHSDGTPEIYEIEKDFDEDLGIVFKSAVFDRIKPCTNHCIFCFVDQQPKGLRNTLYVKDDDYRLSYLQGTYITLTNLTEKDKERIKRMHLGPFYISVHTTNPDLRVKMLRNPNAGKALDNLKWFRKNKIPFHAQIVLCPGLNDGEELERTLKDLAELKNTVLSTAIVPVGITQFRQEKLKQVDAKCAKETIKIASKYKRVCCSDEFFLIANEPIPSAKYYGNFCQLDDGVGSLRLTYDDFKKLKLPKSISKPYKIVFACSYAAKNMFEKITEKLAKIKNLEVKTCPVKSEYWGKDITVAGLITTEDLIRTVKDEVCDIVVIPSVMLRPYTQDFLDGKNLDYVREKSGKNFMVQENIYSLKEVVNFIYTL